MFSGGIEYSIVRSKRKTVTISIRDGVVTVKAPPRTSVEYINEFVAQKSAWIVKKLTEYKNKSNMFAPLERGECALLHGRYYDIVPSQSHKRITVDKACGVLYMPVKYADKTARDKALAAWYKRTAQTELSARLGATSARIGLSYRSFALTNARTKWGSCDGECNIRLNWRLVMLDDGSVEYVIVHELAHTVHHDHSREFWAEVGKFVPDHAARKKRLKTYSVLTSMFR